MRYFTHFVIALTLAFMTGTGASRSSAEDNAPTGDREAVAKLIRDPLIAQAATAKIDGKADERHRVVIKNPIKDIVTYWRSSVSGTGEFVEPHKNLTVEVPTLKRAKGKATFDVKAAAPIKGKVSGRATTDDGKQLISVSSPYTCKLVMAAECVVTRAAQPGGGVSYKIEVTKWEPKVADLKFDNGLDRVKGPIENMANEKSRAEANKLRDQMNAALRKAYEEGRLTLPE